MKLNLGCGRIIFPLDRDNLPPYKVHLEPFHDSMFEPGWVNVDKYQNPGVNETIDLFKFPWIRSSNGSPFNDSSVDEIYCGHILEHVPHKVEVDNSVPFNWAKKYHRQVEELDGFFVFFAEVYRILKPDGLVYVRCPYAFSTAAMADPTHTRYIVPGSFSYLAGQDDTTKAPFDYHLPMRFEQFESILTRATTLGGQISAMIKERDSDQNELRLYNDVVDEIRIVLRAVKDQ